MPPLFHPSIISSIHSSIYPSSKRCTALEVMVNSVLKHAGYPVCSSISIVYPSWPFSMLLLLSRFSRVWLCSTPWTSAHQPPLPLGFSRQEYCHFLLQCMKVKSESEVAQSCPTLRTPWTAAYQSPPSMGFSRQEYWSGVPLPSLSSCYRRSKNKQFVSCVVFSWIVYFDLASESF